MQKATVNEPDVVVIEIADGILQRETKMLLENKTFMSVVDHVVFSCGDSLSALSGVNVLREMNIFPTALSGLFTASPLLIDEVRKTVDVPVLTIDQLMSGDFNRYFDRQGLKALMNE